MSSMRVVGVVCGFVLGIGIGGVGTYFHLERARLGRPTEPSGTAGHGEHVPAAGDRHGSATTEDAHAGEAHEGHRLVLSEQAIKQVGVETAAAAGGRLEETRSLPAEVVLNSDKVAHIVPRVAGIVRRVDRFLGDEVKPGEVMAVLESRELAEAKAGYLAAQQRLALAKANFKSAEALNSRQIMPDLEFLAVKKSLAEAEIELRTGEHKLHAMGLAHEDFQRLSDQNEDLAIYELRAPFAGTIIQKHIALGEVLTEQSDAFILADLSTVWLNVTVYAKDAARMNVGQVVHVRAEGVAAQADGRISYVSPIIAETTRTATARVVLENSGRIWKPGMFVAAVVVVGNEPARVLVPNEAVQTVESRPVVFVREGDGFEPVPVTVGRRGGTHSEIIAGLEPGQSYVVKGAFMLKAEMAKGAGGHEH